MWTWSDLHCDYVHPVGEGFHGQFWLRNNSIVRIDGEPEYENECISDKDSKWKYGLIMHPQTQNWTEGFYLPHGWKEEFGCLENGSCFYVGNATNDDIEFNSSTTNSLIILVGSLTSFITILENLGVCM